MIDPRDKKKVIEDIEEENEDEIEVNYEEYENLFFVPTEEEVEEACEIAHLLYIADNY